MLPIAVARGVNDHDLAVAVAVRSSLDDIGTSESSPERTQVCVVGGGPAGLIFAAQVAREGVSVLLLESGDVRFDFVANALGELEPSSSPFVAHSVSRRRQLGGTAWNWHTMLRRSPAARLLRLDDVDFEARQWMPHSGWPFGPSELKRYYELAELICQVNHDDDLAETSGAWFGPLDVPVRTVVERFGFSRVFTLQLPDQLKTARDVRIVTRATVIELLTDPTGVRMSGVRYARPGRSSTIVHAPIVVLAAGGIENPRLLLLSRTSHSNGLGNGFDLVGRFFMDHHRLDWGALMPERPEVFDSAGIFDLAQGRGGFRMGKLAIAPTLLRSAGLLNSSVHLAPRQPREQQRAISQLRSLLSLRRSDPLAALSEFGRDWYLLGGLVDTCMRLSWHQRRFPGRIDGGSWSRMPHNSTRFGSFKLLQTIEQSPSPTNRVTLIDARDQLGQRRAGIQCSLSSLDIESVHRSRRIIADALLQRGVGRVIPNEGMPVDSLGGIHHHMGTTRMHESPRKGVTNAHGEVHGVRNLFVVGSSLFPTGGYANPTLTILALALRSAEYVAKRVGQVAPTSIGR